MSSLLTYPTIEYHFECPLRGKNREPGVKPGRYRRCMCLRPCSSTKVGHWETGKAERRPLEISLRAFSIRRESEDLLEIVLFAGRREAGKFVCGNTAAPIARLVEPFYVDGIDHFVRSFQENRER
jgi:hypothetical protein